MRAQSPSQDKHWDLLSLRPWLLPTNSSMGRGLNPFKAEQTSQFFRGPLSPQQVSRPLTPRFGIQQLFNQQTFLESTIAGHPRKTHFCPQESQPDGGGAGTGHTRDTPGLAGLLLCARRVAGAQRTETARTRTVSKAGARSERRGFSRPRLSERPRRARASSLRRLRPGPRPAREGSGAGARTQGVGGAPRPGTRTGWSLP